MAKVQRQKIVVFPDINLLGVFVKAEEMRSDPDYRYIYYKPIADSFRVRPPKTQRYPQPIHHEKIFSYMGTKNLPGVEPEVIYVQTDETGGFLSSLMSKKDRKIKELKQEVSYYKDQATVASVDAENANAGVSRKLSELEQIKPRRTGGTMFPRAPVIDRSGVESGKYFDSEEYDDFENR